MKDMTQGSPVRHIIGFAIPMLIGNVFQQIYNVVDTVIVGRYLGEKELAGVGSTGTLTMFLLALVYGMGNGAGLVLAQCIGKKDADNMKKAIAALAWVAGVLTIVISILGIFASRVFLTILNVPDNVIDYSVEYLQVIYSFVFGSVIYNGASAILRSTGDSKTPLYALIGASILNVVLDLVFIIQFHLGVKGAAYATICSQCLSAYITVGYIIKKREVMGLSHIKWRPQKRMVGLIIKTGFPSAFQSCMISLGGMSVQRLINSFGSSVMAAYVAANRIDSVAIQVIVSIGTALSVFTGQNMGVNQIERIKEALKKTLWIMVLVSSMIAVCVYVFRVGLLELFLDRKDSADAIAVGASYLLIIGIAYVIAGIMQSYQNVIRGSGDVNVCMIAGLTELSGRIIFAYLLSSIIGVSGIWIATPISWGCGCVIPVVRYYSGKWQEKKLV